MPNDISTLATTMSITRNGMKIMKPIWNADFSSLVTKAGMITRMGAVCGVTAASSLASLANKAKSDCRVCLVMNSRIGASALASASSNAMALLL